MVIKVSKFRPENNNVHVYIDNDDKMVISICVYNGIYLMITVTNCRYMEAVVYNHNISTKKIFESELITEFDGSVGKICELITWIFGHTRVKATLGDIDASKYLI